MFGQGRSPSVVRLVGIVLLASVATWFCASRVFWNFDFARIKMLRGPSRLRRRIRRNPRARRRIQVAGRAGGAHCPRTQSVRRSPVIRLSGRRRTVVHGEGSGDDRSPHRLFRSRRFCRPKPAYREDSRRAGAVDARISRARLTSRSHDRSPARDCPARRLATVPKPARTPARPSLDQPSCCSFASRQNLSARAWDAVRISLASPRSLSPVSAVAASPWLSPYLVVISPATFAAAALVSGLPQLRTLVMKATPVGRGLTHAWIWAGAHQPAAAATLAIVTTLATGLYGGRAIGGSDEYGYTSQAELWLKGNLEVEQPFVQHVPFADAARIFSPLGYRPHFSKPAVIVPTYASGLPMLLALTKLIGGQEAMFWVVPVSAGLLVLVTYGIGRRLGAETAGLIAAALVATSPPMLAMAMLVMTDVPVAAAWAAAFYFRARRDGAVGGSCRRLVFRGRPHSAEPRASCRCAGAVLPAADAPRATAPQRDVATDGLHRGARARRHRCRAAERAALWIAAVVRVRSLV